MVQERNHPRWLKWQEMGETLDWGAGLSCLIISSPGPKLRSSDRSGPGGHLAYRWCWLEDARANCRPHIGKAPSNTPNEPSPSARHHQGAR